MADAARLEHHERDETLPVLLVVDAEDGRFGHLRVRGQRLLDLDRVDVLAAGDDHLVVAADHEQATRIVEVSHVTRCHEAVVEVLGGAGGVAVEQRAAADEDLSHLACRHLR